ncbi:MAG TPA: tetratricopeptide repeat-containing diguanylate cyclase [Pyrinomonadaceae bacterium]|nr:tetratricopeptide repeat-containing diguanylate cyclase [Pyrinomonadaceae bacterium]
MNEKARELERVIADPDFEARPATARVDTLNELAWELKYADARRAHALSHKARTLAETEAYELGLAYALRNSGGCNYLLANYATGLDDATAALDIFERLGDEPGRAHALTVAGNIHERLGRHARALECHQQSFHIRETLGDRAGASVSLNNLGNVYTSFGEYATALSYYLRSLSLCESIGSAEGVGRATNNVGHVYLRLGEHEKALEHFRRALAVKREIGDRQNEGHVLLNIGQVYEAACETEAARGYYFESLERARAVGDRQAEAVCLARLGKLYKTLGEYSDALEFYTQSLRITEETGIRYYEAEARVEMGETLTALGQTPSALEHLARALALASELDSSDLVYRAHRALSEAYELGGELLRALAHYKEFHHTRERVFGEDTAKRVKHVTTRAEVERAEREAEIYRLRNVELAEAYRGLKAADEQKTALLEQLRGQAGELERQSKEDALTGLSNRRHFDAQLAQEFARARRFGRDLSVVMADLDDFKRVNDELSHAVGDEVLRRVAEILRAGCRRIDVVARYGGEEFVLLLVETTAEQARVLCEKLCEAVREYDWREVHPRLTRVRLSLGLSGDARAPTPEALLAVADAKLYEAKRTGKDRVCW